jgi:uncharacterized membrane protein
MDDRTKSLKTLTTIVYALYSASFVIGISSIVAIIINYVKKDDVAGTLFESHFRWQIRTFWFALLWSVIGIATFLVVIGWFILIANAIWVIYRIVKGWLRLNDNLPMYDAGTRAAPPPAPNATATIPTASTPVVEEATRMFVPESSAKLVCIVGVLQGMTFPIGSGVVIGRSQEADIVVPDSQVSNRHAWVGSVNGRLMLRDLQSTNGSYINDNLAAPVHEAELKDGDLVVLGKHNQVKFRLSFA